MGGHGSLLPNLDVDGTGLLLLVGTNPVVSHGHASALPDPVTRLRQVAEPGRPVGHGPGADGDRPPGHPPSARCARAQTTWCWPTWCANCWPAGPTPLTSTEHADGVDRLAAAVAPFSRRVAAAASGLDEGDLDELVAAVRASGRVTVLTGTGTTMGPERQPHRMDGVDRSGRDRLVRGAGRGVVQPRLPDGSGRAQPAHQRRDLPGPGRPAALTSSAASASIPAPGLADEIEAGNVRALFVFGGSPLTALPDTKRLRAAFARLDVLAVADVVETDTVALATHVLPVTGQFERSDVTYYVELFLSAVAAQYTPAIVAPPAERRPLWWALGSLGRRLGLDILDGGLDPDDVQCRGPPGRPGRPLRRRTPPGFSTAPRPAWPTPLRPRGWVHGHVLPEGRWRVAPAPLVEQLASTPLDRRAGLVLTPRRVTRRMNSAIGDVVATAARPDDFAVLLNAGDALAAGIADGEQVRIRSRTGELVAGPGSGPTWWPERCRSPTACPAKT